MREHEVHEPWRKLKIGDRVRFVAMPTELSRPGYFVHRDTLQVYRRLIRRGRSVRVGRIDEWKCPWIRCQFQRRDGRIEYHYLMINHDGRVKVKRRKRR